MSDIMTENYVIYCNVAGHGRLVCAAEKNELIEAENAFGDIKESIILAHSLGPSGDPYLRKCTAVYLKHGDETLSEWHIENETIEG